jgi:hypothetical protein
MEQLLTFLSKPIIITLLTLTIGSYLFTRLTERRAKKDKIREKSLQLIEDVGSSLNSVLSLIHGHIRNSNFEIQKTSPINEKRADLFTKRFSVRIRSKAFLQSDEFWQKYEQLTFEIDRIVRLMMALSENYDLEEVIKRIKDNQERFSQSWPFEERSRHSQYPPPSNELVIWADMIWDRSIWLLSQNINVILR